MREQVIIQRVQRSAPTVRGRGNGIVQHPAQRERGGSAGGNKRGEAWRRVRGWMPMAAKILLAVCIGVLLFTAYRAATVAAFFRVQRVDVVGAEHMPAEEVETAVRRRVASTGVWKADLAAISHELERHPWVRSVVVSRVLPAALRVRLTERTPLAVVRTSSGRLVWVDEDAVVLGAIAPTAALPAFFIRGWDESQTDLARAENRERTRKYREVERAWKEMGIAERVSEINFDDLRDVRAQLAGPDARIEVRLGKDDFGGRLKRALEVLDEQRQTARGPFITRLDASLDQRVIVGFGSDAHAHRGAGEASTEIDKAEEKGAPARTSTQAPGSPKDKFREEAQRAAPVRPIESEKRTKIAKQTGKEDRAKKEGRGKITPAEDPAAKSLALKTRPRRVDGNDR